MAVEISLVSAATARLLETVAVIDPRSPSLLPGWSKGHVVTHLARNADAQRRLIAGALAGREVEQYPSGREEEIEAGAGRDAGELVADLRASCAALDGVWASLGEAEWELTCRTAAGRRTLRSGLLARWREVEVHHVDLAAGYLPRDWSVEFVREFLPRAVSGLPGRGIPLGGGWRVRETGGVWRVTADGAEVVGEGADLLAWLLGRGAHGVDAGEVEDLPRLFPFG